jgi:hypothetical protein
MKIGAEAGPHNTRGNHVRLFWILKLCRVPIGADRNPARNGLLEQLQAAAPRKRGVPLRRRSTLFADVRVARERMAVSTRSSSSRECLGRRGVIDLLLR